MLCLLHNIIPNNQAYRCSLLTIYQYYYVQYYEVLAVVTRLIMSKYGIFQQENTR